MKTVTTTLALLGTLVALGSLCFRADAVAPNAATSVAAKPAVVAPKPVAAPAPAPVAPVEQDDVVMIALTGINEDTGLPTVWDNADTEDGQMVLKYMIKCALPAGESVELHDSKMRKHRFEGGVGVAPEWKNGDCGTKCQEWVSSCMLSHINLTGKHVPIYTDAPHENVGWGRQAEYPRQEGAYFGNLFAANPVAYACKGRNADVNPIPGRLCLGQATCPYINAAPAGSCADICAEHASGDGYTECTVDGKKFTRPMTVWTH